MTRYLLYLATAFAVALAYPFSACAMPGSGDRVVAGKQASEIFLDPLLADLARAACDGDARRVSRAIEAGADANGRGLEDTTPLIWALLCDAPTGVEALLKAGANPNQAMGPDRQGRGFDPMWIAAGHRNGELLSVLLRYGGNPNAQLKEGSKTPIFAAVHRAMDGYGWENYELLLARGADTHGVYEEKTIAKFLSSMNQWDRVSSLLDRGYQTRLDDLASDVAYTRARDLEYLPPGQSHWLEVVAQKLTAKGHAIGQWPEDRKQD